MCPWKLTLGVVSLLVTVSTALPINLLVPFSVPQVLAQTVEERTVEADQLVQQGIEQLETNQIDAGIQSFQQALTIYREIKDRPREAIALIALGLIFNSLNKYSQGVEYLQQSLTIVQELGKPQTEAQVLENIWVALFYLGDYPQIIDSVQKYLTVARQIGNRLGEGKALGYLGNAYYSMGNYNQAIEYQRQSLAIAREFKDRLAEGKSLGNIGNSFYSLGDYSQAINYYQQSLVIVQEIKEHSLESNILNNIGVIYESIGNYNQAINYHQESLIVARRIDNKSGQFYSLGSLGNVYNSLGNYSQALKYYEQALNLARTIDDIATEGKILCNIGIVFFRLEQYREASEYFHQYLSLSQKIGNPAGEATALENLGNNFLALGNYNQAIDYFHKSWQIQHRIGHLSGEQDSLASLGNAYYALKDYKKAIEYHEQSLAITQQIKDRPSEGRTLSNLGAVFLSSGNLAEAEKTLRAAIKVWESLRNKVDNKDINKITIFETQGLAYRLLQETLVIQNKANAALEISEQGRTRALVELLSKRLSTESSIQLALPPSPNIDKVKKIAQKQNAIFIEYSIIYDGFARQGKDEVRESELYIWVVKPTGQIAFRKVDLKPLWQQQNTSLQEFVTKNLELVSAGINRGESDNPTLSNNPSFAPGDLVRLNNDRPNYPAWQVVSVNPQNRTLRLRQPSFAEGVIIERPIADVTKVSSPNAQNKRLQQLHKLLIEPIADLLPTDPNARVIFIPQGALFFVPFPALQDADNKFLIEKHTILTAPSIQVLDLTHQQRQRVPETTKDVLVVGNPTMPKVSPFPGEPARQLSPLPAAEQEATEVAQMFKAQAVIGNQATKSAILPQLSKARIIHLATHGLLDDYTGGGVPGAIALAPSPNDNGLLTASEILDLKLNAELVVLSACNTGKGRITGDGVIGLSRSLISAGVPSVVVSLWSVPDAPTASLMTEFYRQMQRSPDKAQALRQAMLTTIRTHPNPKDWAAFTLIGETE